MTYQLHITSTAKRDMITAADYIKFVLKTPQSANSLLEKAERQINAMAQFPKKFPLVNDSLLASWGIRFTQVNNYLAFYIISEEKQQVTIVRFLYARSNWSAILRLGFPLV